MKIIKWQRKKKALFLVEAPFQLMSVYEAIFFFKLVDYKIVVRFSFDKKNDEQLQNVIDKLFTSDKIQSIYISNNKRGLVDYINALKILIWFSSNSIFYYKVFIGNLESKFLRNIVKMTSRSKLVILDDGIKNILNNEKFDKKYNNYNIFTMLDELKPCFNQRIFVHRFDNLKRVILDSFCVKRKETVFIGGCLSETGIMKESEYLAILKKIVFVAETKVIYIPHRRESDEKLKKIKEELGIDIDRIDFPVEFYFGERKSIYINIWSFYSAALLSLNYLYSEYDINFVAYKFDYNNLKIKKNMDKIYNYLSKYVNVVDV